jgi:hypothetical protein
MNEYRLPITFIDIDGIPQGLIMNLYLPSIEYYNKLSLEKQQDLYSLFFILNIDNLLNWLKFKPRETYIAKFTNFNYNSITCNEMVSIINSSTKNNLFIIILSGDGYMNSASMDIYPLRWTINLVYDIKKKLSNIDDLIYIKKLSFNIENHIKEYENKIIEILETILDRNIINIIIDYYNWKSFKFI